MAVKVAGVPSYASSSLFNPLFARFDLMVLWLGGVPTPQVSTRRAFILRLTDLFRVLNYGGMVGLILSFTQNLVFELGEDESISI